MRRLVVLALAAASVGVVPLVGYAADGDAKGPRCVDILGGETSYDTTGGTPTVTALITVSGTPCKDLSRYVMHVLTADGASELATATGLPGTLENEVGFRYGFASDPPSGVCVFLTSGSPGGHGFDRAPDTGCVVLGLDGGSGARPFGG
jgi:hypothetical protein